MKRIRCPKCEESILFDDKLYEPGRTLVFECPSCKKQFKLRIPAARPVPSETAEQAPAGTLVVIENAFHFKQEIPLYPGDNVIGRSVPGTKINAPITTVDPSVDTRHCIVHVGTAKNGSPVFTLRDAPSSTGTFLMNQLLGTKEKARISDGSVITIGATTMILRCAEADGEAPR